MITAEVADEALRREGVDARGLDRLDRAYLDTIAHQYGGGPVGINAIAATLTEDVETLEDVVEPYLLKIGFVQRTAQGRKTTPAALAHLGRAPARGRAAAAAVMLTRAAVPQELAAATTLATGGIDVWDPTSPQIRVLVADRHARRDAAGRCRRHLRVRRQALARRAVDRRDAGRQARAGHDDRRRPVPRRASSRSSRRRRGRRRRCRRRRSSRARSRSRGGRSRARGTCAPTTSDQRWGGVDAEHPAATAAVAGDARPHARVRRRPRVACSTPRAAAGTPPTRPRCGTARRCRTCAASTTRTARRRRTTAGRATVPLDRAVAAFGAQTGGTLTGTALTDPDATGRPRGVALLGTTVATIPVADFRRALGYDVVRSLWLRAVRIDATQAAPRLVIEGSGPWSRRRALSMGSALLRVVRRVGGRHPRVLLPGNVGDEWLTTSAPTTAVRLRKFIDVVVEDKRSFTLFRARDRGHQRDGHARDLRAVPAQGHAVHVHDEARAVPHDARRGALDPRARARHVPGRACSSSTWPTTTERKLKRSWSSSALRVPPPRVADLSEGGPRDVAAYDYELPGRADRARAGGAARGRAAAGARPGGALEHRTFAAFPELLRAGDVLVLNETRVVRARLRARREGGGDGRAAAAAAARARRVRSRRARVARARAARPQAARRRAARRRRSGRDDRRGARRRTARGAFRRRRRRRGAASRAHGEVPLPPYVGAARRRRRARGALSNGVRARAGQRRGADGIAALHAPRCSPRSRRAASRIVPLVLDVGIGTFRPMAGADDRRARHARRALRDPGGDRRGDRGRASRGPARRGRRHDGAARARGRGADRRRRRRAGRGRDRPLRHPRLSASASSTRC